MKKKKKILLISVVIFIFLIIYFVPFISSTRCGEFDICKVKFGVYICDVTTEAGTGENTGYLKTNLRLYKKVGGFAEYLGLKDIEYN